MRTLVAELGGVRQPDVAAIHAALEVAVSALGQATDWMVATQAHDPARAAAVAVPFLKLWGTVAGGWQMARAALIAARRLTAARGDEGFYRAKLATARFYAEHLLPQAGALAIEVSGGSGSVLALTPEEF